MPTSLVVGMSDMLLPIITNVVNSSLSLGHFPSDWKRVLVDPRLKKTKQGTSLSNLRPVSNLQYLSKLVERAVYDQTTDHVTQSGLYPILQSAYRLGHSTETALLKIQNDILAAMDNQRVTLLVLLDLSAAFDTIDHQVLVNRLYVTYGITGTDLKWFHWYLSSRKQRILIINGSYSSDFDLPQGHLKDHVLVPCSSRCTQVSSSMLLNPISLTFTHTLMILSSISHLRRMVLLLRRMLLTLYKLASGT